MVAGVLIAGVFVFALMQLNWAAVLHAISGVEAVYVLSSLLVSYLAIPLRVQQWRALLDAPGATFRHTFAAICCGHAGNFLFPFQGGEILRALVLSRFTGVSVFRAGSTLLVTRAQDILPIVVIFLSLPLVLPLDGGLIGELAARLGFGRDAAREGIPAERVTAWVALGAACLVCTLVWMAVRGRNAKHAHLGLSAARAGFPRVVCLWSYAKREMRLRGGFRALWISQLYAFGSWTIYVLASIPMLLAFGFEVPSAAATSVAIAGLGTAAKLLPTTPAAVGTYHVSCAAAVLVANPLLDVNKAAAIAVVSHLVSTVGPLLPGLAVLPSVCPMMLGKLNVQVLARERPAPASSTGADDEVRVTRPR